MEYYGNEMGPPPNSVRRIPREWVIGRSRTLGQLLRLLVI